MLNIYTYNSLSAGQTSEDIHSFCPALNEFHLCSSKELELSALLKSLQLNLNFIYTYTYMYVCMYIYMYVCMYVCMYVYIHTYCCSYIEEQRLSCLSFITLSTLFHQNISIPPSCYEKNLTSPLFQFLNFETLPSKSSTPPPPPPCSIHNECSLRKVLLVFRHMGVLAYHEPTDYYRQRHLLILSIVAFWKKYQSKFSEQLRNKEVVLAGDGRHDRMGHSAKYGT